MRTKLFAMGLMAVVAALVAIGPAPGSVIGRQNANANKRAPRAKTGSASKASNSQTMAPAATGEKPKAKKPAHRRPKEMTGVPSGVGNCISRLEQLASKEPMAPYEQGPDQIINNGLLWNDPHSKCSVGSDQGVRNKVFTLATAWQRKDADKVKETLADLKSSYPAEMPMETKKPRRHHTAHKSAASSDAGAASSNSAKPAMKPKPTKSKSANKNSGA